MSSETPNHQAREDMPATTKLDRRQLLKLAGGAIATTLAAPILSACGNTGEQVNANGTPISTGQKRNPNAAQITFWTNMTDIYLKSLQGMTRNFNESQRDVYAELVQVPPEASAGDITKLLTAVRGGTGPDVYLIDRFTISQYAAIGILEDLESYFRREGVNLSHDFIKFAWNETVYNGKVYGLPLDTDVRGICYRKDMVRDAGIDPQEMDPSNGPLTVDRMTEIASKVDKKDTRGNYKQLGFIPWFNQGTLFYSWGFVFGAQYFDSKSCRVTPASKGSVESYQFGYNWAKRYGAQTLQTFLASYAQPNQPPQQSPFITGRLAMQVDGDWDIATFKEYAPKMEYGITHMPVAKKGDKPTTWSGGFAFVIPKGAKNPDAAYKFMRYMSGPAGQRKYTKDTSHLPTRTALLKEKNLFDKRHRFFAQKLLPLSRSRPPLPVGAQYWNELLSAQDAVTLNQSTPRNALNTVASRISLRLGPYCPIEI